MKVNVILVFVVLALGLVDAARRRVRSTTATAVMTTTPALFVGRRFTFGEQPEELETVWDNFDIQKLDTHSESSKNNTSENGRREIIMSRQYPGLPTNELPGNPGETNELPGPISPPEQPIPPPPKPAPGCLGLRGQYPSPKSCANYLNCWDDVVIEQTCPTGLLFNDVKGYCDFASNVNCGDRPPATPKPPLPPGSKLCPDPNGRYRSSTNCSEFYVCTASGPMKFCCPRGTVYNDILNVCDYPYNVDCKGAATPKPTPKPTQPPTQPPSNPPPTYPTQPPTYPSSQPPNYPTQPPNYPSQPPNYPTQPPNYPSQPPNYPTQPPSYPSQQTTYQPQPYPLPPSSYPGNPWLSKVEPDPWHQRPPASQLEIEKERRKQEISADNQLSSNQPAHDVMESSSLVNPWTLFQVIPPELMKAPCNNGDIHRLNNACTNVVVCRNNRPQVVRCSTGFLYDKPSDSCKPFSIAKC